MRTVVINHLTLDGVMQSPGRPDEDTRGDFAHGGWAAAAHDQAVLDAVGERMGQPDGGMLLGRRSYEDMLAAWNAKGGPFKEGLNAARKYVASSNPETALEWPNSTLLSGDVPAAVAELRARPGGNLVTMGSGELIRSLRPRGLIDEYLLIIHPLLLGTGMRLFGDQDDRTELRLLDGFTSDSGLIVAAYAPR